jgi:hypothetical protein
VAALGAAQLDAQRLDRMFGHRRGDHRVGEPDVARLVEVQLGPEGLLVLHVLGPLVHQRALVAIEGASGLVALDHVLMQLGSQVFEDETQVAQDRVVSKDAVPLLEHVPEPQQRQWGGDEAENPPEPWPLHSPEREQEREADECRHDQGPDSMHHDILLPSGSTPASLL